MASAQLTWASATGFDGRELFYGIEGVATNLPESGIGWTAYSGNPIASNINTVTVTSLDDNAKYRFLVRTICGTDRGSFTETSNVKFICPVVDVADITSGNLPFTLVLPSSLLTASSVVKKIRVSLTGVHQTNGAVVVHDKLYTAPFISSYTGQFTHIDCDVDWELDIHYETASSFPINHCSTTEFSTTADTGIKCITFRNGISQQDVTEIYLDGSQILTELQKPGTSSNRDITYLGSHPLGQHISITVPSAIIGSQLTFKHIRAGASIGGGAFSYSGPATLLSSALIDLHHNDIIQVASEGTTGLLAKQSAITKTTSPNGYDLNLKIDLPQAFSQTYALSFVEKDYGTGATFTHTSTLTIASGQITSDTIHVTSSLASGVFSRATYQITSIACNRSTIEITL